MRKLLPVSKETIPTLQTAIMSVILKDSEVSIIFLVYAYSRLNSFTRA